MIIRIVPIVLAAWSAISVPIALFLARLLNREGL